MKHIITVISMSVLLALGLAQNALASGGEEAELKEVEISLDQATLRKGLQVFTEVCMNCHSAKYVRYMDLMNYPEIGLTREQVDELRGDKSLMAGLETELSPEDAQDSYGKVPPDLSLMARAKEGGAAYIYSVLTGYEHDPEGKIQDGNYNKYFPGHNIAMPDPLSWLDHEQSETAELEEQAKNVASFLVFIGDPHQLERERIGWWVMGFLIVLTIVLYLLKKEVWKDVKH